MSGLLTEGNCAAEGSPLSWPLSAETVEDGVFVFPATLAQRRFWLLDQLVPGGNPALNMPLVARLCGRLEREVIERSLNEIVCRHEILRTTFDWEKGHFQQLIARSLLVSVPLVDRLDLTAVERELLPEQLVAEEVRTPFDLARGPLVRARLVRLGTDEHLLVIALHHIVSDGWSNGVLLRELGELYAAFVRGQPSPLPELPIQFADFCEWQREHASESGLDEDLAYWRETLAGDLPVLDLPTDRPRRPARGRPLQSGARQETLAAPLVQALKAAAARGGATPYMLFLAAFTLLLSRYAGGQEDILLNTPSANRDRREIEPLIGPFVNPLLLRIDLTGEPTFRELLARVRKIVLGAFSHAAVPFERLLDELPPRRLQANFVHQTHFLRPASLPELAVAPLVTSDVALHEWTVVLTERSTETNLQLAYNSDLYDAATIDRVLACYRRLLKAIAAPDGLETVIWRLPLESAVVPEAGRALLANRWRLPAESVRWMDRCFEAVAAGEGEFGRARAGIGLLVLDRHLEPAPVGVAGEIYVRGWPEGASDFPAFESVNDPRLGLLFGTGDLARRRADGRLAWMGRADEQVRAHGLPVDTLGIEAALRAHPRISEAAVLWRRAPDGEHRLMAYVEAKTASASVAVWSAACLRDFLRETLPEESLPANFVPLEHFPQTADGRLDVAALPELPARWCEGAERKGKAPYLTIHYQLLDLWQQLLGTRPLGIQDDFFALGGNSLLAMRMLYRVEEIFGKAVYPVTLFRQPTIELLAAELLKDEEGQPSGALVKINDQGARAPIFYLHGDFHGGGFYSMKLSRQLGLEQPFYVLPPTELTDPGQPPTIEEMAARHIASIREVRPHGPYVIGGFCLGGLIAFEVAQQLRAAGEVVERLLVIDANLRSRRLRRLRRGAELLGWLRGWSADRQLYLFCRWHFLLARLRRWWHMGLRDKAGVVRRRGARWWRHWRPGAGPAEPSVGIGSCVAASPESNAGWFDPRWDVPVVYLWSSGGYAPPPYAGAATLLLSRDLFHERGQRQLRVWQRHLAKPDVRELPGSHLGCITEHVDALAEIIARSLEGPVGGGS